MKLEKEGLVVTPLTEQKTGLWDMAFIWFCANVAVPRLMIGGSLAELGFGKMMLILLAGNILVFLPLLALGVIGFNVRIPTMAATRMTFGVKGSYLPSVANGIQLLGWGANVTVICGASINSIIKAMTGFENLALWIVVTGIVQLVITAYGVRSITWLQRVSVPLLAILTVVSAVLIIKKALPEWNDSHCELPCNLFLHNIKLSIRLDGTDTGCDNCIVHFLYPLSI